MTTQPDPTEPDTTQLAPVAAEEADPAPYDDALLDEEWLAAPHRRSRLRTVLVLLLAASLLFLAGAQVQRRFGPSSSSGATAAFSPPGGGALPSGFPGGAAPSGAGTGLGDSGAGTGDAGSASTSSIIGTVVSKNGNRWTVKDLGGKTHVVLVPTTAQIVRETPLAADKVARGATVDISGSTSRGTLSASTITVR